MIDGLVQEARVIPRMRIDQGPFAPRAIWPAVVEQPRSPLFLGREPLRKLVVMVDVDQLASVDRSVWSKEWLLAGLLTLDLIERIYYADGGPPDEVLRRHDDLMGEHTPGWVVIGSPDVPYGIQAVRWSNGQEIWDSSVSIEIVEAGAADLASGAYSELEPEAAAVRRRADALAAQGAEAVGADLFVTERLYLHRRTRDLTKGVTYCGIDGALALVGLYLRTQGVFLYSRDPAGRGNFTTNRGLFFWVGARELLPSAWRWFAACVQHSTGGGDGELIYLGQSVLTRVQRALQVRDEVHVAVNKPANNDTADEALSALDGVLLLLMGAVDSTARVAHQVLGITIDPYLAGWQRAQWMTEVTAAWPSLGRLFVPGTDHSNTLTILRVLRNSIHGAALSSLGVGRPRAVDRFLVRLPVSDQSKLTAAFNALDGAAAWGVEQVLPGQLHADPGLFLEQLLPRVLVMLNDVMDATPVEQLAHVQLQASDLVPPVAPNSPFGSPFDEMNRQSIRWQLGL